MSDGIGFLAGVLIWGLAFAAAMAFAGRRLRAGDQERVMGWLRGSGDVTWVQVACRLSDLVLGRSLTGFGFILASIGATLLMAVLVALAGSLTSAGPGVPLRQESPFEGVPAGALIGAAVIWLAGAGYLSHWKSCRLMRRFARVRTIAGQAALLFADFFLTAVIVSAGLVGLLALGASFDPVSALPPGGGLAPLVYPVFLPFLLAMMIALSSVAARQAMGLFGSGATRPMAWLGLSGSGLIIAAGLALAVPSGLGADQGYARLSASDRERMDALALACPQTMLAPCAAEELGGSFDEAEALFQKACTAGDQRGCHFLASLAHALETDARDADDGQGPEPGAMGRAAALFETACSGGAPAACVSLGRFHQGGEAGVRADPSRAVALFEQACTLSHAAGCREQARALENGQGVSQDQARAAILYDQACADDDGPACAYLGGLVQARAESGVDTAKAAALYRRACELEVLGACTLLGTYHLNGRGVPRDRTLAVSLFRQACGKGDGAGCTNLGALVETLSRGARSGTAGSQSDGTNGTNGAAGRTGAPDVVDAAGLYRRGCDLGSAIGCTNLGFMYRDGRGVDRDPAKAVDFFRLGCDAGDPAGCTNFGFQLDTGRGIAPDPDRAQALFRQGCDGGDMRGCTLLGMTILQSLPPAVVDQPDSLGSFSPMAEVRALLDKACAGGDNPACRALNGVADQ